jgi:long-chain acyl-CoA synthetase
VQTVAALWERALTAGRPYPAYLVEAEGGWQPVSWADAGRSVDELAAGFLSIGVEKGDRVALLSGTRLEWTLCDLALSSIGAVTVPIYPTSSTIECAYILGNAAARAVVCESADHYATVAPVRSELAALDHILAMEGSPGAATPLATLRESGRLLLARTPDIVGASRARIEPDDLLTILYTSGTTGPPKGCILKHRHFWVMVEMLRQVPGMFAGNDRVLLYLPLAHNFARLVQYAGIGIGYTVAFCPDIERISEALVAVKPTIFPSVPRLFEKAHASINAAFATAKGPRRRLLDWALGVGRRAAALRQSGTALPRSLELQLSLADRLVFSKVHARFGGELRFAVSGGAPLAREVSEFFLSVGILVLEGYGLTECTTASHLNEPQRFRFGTVGLPMAGVRCELTPDGEVLLRGDNVFVGYYGDERATRDALTDDGWLRTGDLGQIDGDGFLTISDRKKDILITAGGKNVSPQNLENALRAFPIVSEALVVGDRRPYIVALISIDRDEVARARLDDEAARAAVERAVASVNETLARPEQIKRFAVIGRDFEAERGEVTPTLKLRRHVCADHFQDVIESLYA